VQGWLARGPARSGMAHGAAGRGAGGTGSPARILGGGRGRFCQRARLVRETGRDAGDAGRAVSAGRACGRGEAGCGPQGRVGRAELREKRGSWAGLGWTARVGWVSGFGFSFHYSFSNSIFVFQTSSNQQLFEFKNNLNSNLCTQTNKRDAPA